jgi:hypothetical protein
MDTAKVEKILGDIYYLTPSEKLELLRRLLASGLFTVDPEFTPEELAEIEEARAEAKRGDIVSIDEVARKYDL